MPDDPRTEPVSIKVLLTTGEGVAVEWRDGHQSRYTFPYLRDRCPCATCREQRASAAGKTTLPIYKETVRAVQAEPVGNYAVRFVFSDAHATGIYSFSYFRQICPCAECSAARKGEAE
ncbi:MAG: gamma-butyrobetaine hydroxylase-like domain-containing protein [Terriglobia bacterium]